MNDSQPELPVRPSVEGADPRALRIFLIHRGDHEPEVVERENINFVDGWVVLSDGLYDCFKRNVLAIPGREVLKVEEIMAPSVDTTPPTSEGD